MSYDFKLSRKLFAGVKQVFRTITNLTLPLKLLECMTYHRLEHIVNLFLRHKPSNFSMILCIVSRISSALILSSLFASVSIRDGSEAAESGDVFR